MGGAQMVGTLPPLRFMRTGTLLSSCSEKVVVAICHTR